MSDFKELLTTMLYMNTHVTQRDFDPQPHTEHKPLLKPFLCSPLTLSLHHHDSFSEPQLPLEQKWVQEEVSWDAGGVLSAQTRV